MERDWWVRTLLVLRRPAQVFAALRDGGDDERQEPVLAIVFLAGIAGVLSTNAAARILDDFEIDALVLAVWAFLAGGLYGTFGYWAVGFLVYAGGRALGARLGYRRARHLLAYAAVPLALSLAVWPVRAAVYGEDAFRTGGTDTGPRNTIFEGLELAAVGWSAALLVTGLRAYAGWSWLRAVAAALPALAVPALVLARAHGLV